MGDRSLTIDGRESDLKYTIIVLLHFMGVSVPVVCWNCISRNSIAAWVGLTEVASQEGLGSVGSPFPVDNVVVPVDIESEERGALSRPA